MFADTSTSEAIAAYDALAAHYDEFTKNQDYASWTTGLLELARRHGLTGRRALDAGCGTGKSFLPLLRGGFSITACDGSPQMLDRARDACGGAARLLVADVRDLPCLGSHDLAWALCDVANYLLTPDELAAMARGLRRNLAPGGVALFDCSTTRAFRDFFGTAQAVEQQGLHLFWQGGVDATTFAPGDIAAAVLYAFAEGPSGSWSRSASHHVQRHHPRDVVVRALRAAGLELAAIYGQTKDLRFESVVDEERHDKAIYVALNPTEGGEP